MEEPESLLERVNWAGLAVLLAVVTFWAAVCATCQWYAHHRDAPRHQPAPVCHCVDARRPPPYYAPCASPPKEGDHLDL